MQRLYVDSVISNLAFSKGDAREFGGIIATTYGTRRSGFTDLRVLNNTIVGVGRTGIAVSNHEWPKGYDTGLRIAGNSVRWTRGDSIIVRGSRGARIDHNVSAHGAALWPCQQCGRISPYTANAGIWTAASQSVTIEHNEVYGEHVKGGDGEAFDIDASTRNVVLQYNYAHDNQGGAVLLCGSRDAVVRFNIFQNNSKSAIAFIGSIPAHNTLIYNNTIYGSTRTHANVVRTFNGLHGSGIRFFNNLVYSYGPGRYYWPTRVTSYSNSFVGSHAVGEPAGSGDTYRDPQLRNPGSGRTGIGTLRGYQRAKNGQPQTGAAVPKSISKDFFGKRISATRPPRGASA